MEHCENGDLSKLIKKNAAANQHFPESQVAIWFCQLVKALEFIHSHKILHRDIKSSNIFITKEGSLKLGDFGIAKVLDSTCDVAHTLVGTPIYMSPELCMNQPYASKSDIWALGCVFYEVLALRPPFTSQNLLMLISKITKENQEALPRMYSESLQDLISSMLIKDEDARISTKELAAHHFFAEYFFNPIQSIENLIPRDSSLNPLDFSDDNDYYKMRTVEDISCGPSLSSGDDDCIPQDERSDDDKQSIFIRSSSLEINLLSRREDVKVLAKKNEALKKFGNKDYLDAYTLLKKMRQLENAEDIVRNI